MQHTINELSVASGHSILGCHWSVHHKAVALHMMVMVLPCPVIMAPEPLALRWAGPSELALSIHFAKLEKGPCEIVFDSFSAVCNFSCTFAIRLP